MSQRLSLRQLLVRLVLRDGLLVRWSVIVRRGRELTSHELEKNVRLQRIIASLNRSRRLGLTADGTFSGF
jgi:hypothetical protein